MESNKIRLTVPIAAVPVPVLPDRSVGLGVGAKSSKAASARDPNASGAAAAVAAGSGGGGGGAATERSATTWAGVVGRGRFGGAAAPTTAAGPPERRSGVWRHVPITAQLFVTPHPDWERLRSEMAILSRIRHPHIVLFLGATPSRVGRGGSLLLITESMPNGSLRECLASAEKRAEWAIIGWKRCIPGEEGGHPPSATAGACGVDDQCAQRTGLCTQVRFVTVTVYANRAHNLTRSP